MVKKTPERLRSTRNLPRNFDPTICSEKLRTISAEALVGILSVENSSEKSGLNLPRKCGSGTMNFYRRTIVGVAIEFTFCSARIFKFAAWLPLKPHWEIKGRFRKRVVLANVPSFRFSFLGNIRRNHPFGNHPFVRQHQKGSLGDKRAVSLKRVVLEPKRTSLPPVFVPILENNFSDPWMQPFLSSVGKPQEILINTTLPNTLGR